MFWLFGDFGFVVVILVLLFWVVAFDDRRDR